ncbi:MAG: hypothetical protein V2B19_01090 [Pseudomonadota bacterium]
MKHYVIDELRPQDYEQVKKYLDDQLETSGVEGLYWIPLKEDLLTDLQVAHSECRPLFFAVALEPDQLSCELLVRTRKKLQCDCMAYATETQRNWIIDWADGIFEQLGLLS